MLKGIRYMDEVILRKDKRTTDKTFIKAFGTNVQYSGVWGTVRSVKNNVCEVHFKYGAVEGSGVTEEFTLVQYIPEEELEKV